MIWELFCMLVSFFGLAIRVLTVGYTPHKTSGRNTKEQIAETLNTTGIYSVVRHPLYLGNFFMWLGIALFAHTIWVTVIFILAYWVYYERIMFAEEAFLRNKFGQAYASWTEKTPAFIPCFRNYAPSSLPFSVKTVLRREYNGLLAVIVVMFVFEMLGDWVVEHKVEVDVHWAVLLGSGCILWGVLRFLKKRTRLLNVDGR
ncbi:MAG: isoprenylcysteine carboxylmethyltransferase family protein [Lentisphaerota bacterium]